MPRTKSSLENSRWTCTLHISGPYLPVEQAQSFTTGAILPEKFPEWQRVLAGLGGIGGERKMLPPNQHYKQITEKDSCV